MKIKQKYIECQLSNLLFYGFIIDFQNKAWYIIMRKQKESKIFCNLNSLKSYVKKAEQSKPDFKDRMDKRIALKEK